MARSAQSFILASRSLREPIYLEWLTLIGMLAFAAWLLGGRGVWGLLLRSDPTGITFVILIIFVAACIWCGVRSRQLQHERHALRADGGVSPQSWSGEYLRCLQSAPRDANAPGDLLIERTHGVHATAWWVNAVLLKLGLLGKVIGFSILALELGALQNFDPSQSQALLKSLTAGLGVALLTTMTGLVANILLGLQLTRLDRYADLLVVDIQQWAVAHVSGVDENDEIEPNRPNKYGVRVQGLGVNLASTQASQSP